MANERNDKLDSEQSLPTLTDVVLDAYTEICELFGRNSGTYDPTPKEVYAVQDNLNRILREVVQASLRTSSAMDLLKALEITVAALDKIRCERRDVPWDQTGPAIEIGQSSIAKARQTITSL